VKRRVFPPLLCAIVLGVIPWRLSFRFAVSFRRKSPSKFKNSSDGSIYGPQRSHSLIFPWITTNILSLRCMLPFPFCVLLR